MPRAASHTGLALHQAPGPRGLLPLDHLIRMPHDISGAPPADPKRRAAEPDDRSGWLAAESSAPASSRASRGDARNTVAGVSAVSLTLCVLLWARPGAEDGLIAYEDQVLGLVSGHGGQVLQRARGTGTGGQPLENQLPEFLSARALDAFMTDGRRRSLAGERDSVISKTEVIKVKLVPPVPGQWTAPDRSGGFPSSGKEWQMEKRFEVTASTGTLAGLQPCRPIPPGPRGSRASLAAHARAGTWDSRRCPGCCGNRDTFRAARRHFTARPPASRVLARGL